MVELILEGSKKRKKFEKSLAEKYLQFGEQKKKDAKKMGKKAFLYWTLPDNSKYTFDGGSLFKKKVD